MLTRREVLVGAMAFGALMRIRTTLAKVSQPVTPVGFEVPAGACDCHTHIYGDPERFPFFSGRVYTPERRCLKSWRRSTRRFTYSMW